MLLRDVLIVIVFFGMGLTAVTTIIGGFETSYEEEISMNMYSQADNATLNATFVKITEMRNTTESIGEQIKAGRLEDVTDGGVVAKGSWSVIMMVYNSLGTVGTMVTDLSNSLLIPVEYTNGIIAIITIIIIFTILSTVTRRPI